MSPEQERPSLFILTVIRGPDRGKQLRIAEGKVVTIGTGDEDAFQLSDPKVLAGHCAMAVKDGAVLVENRTASAGTYIGDKKIKRARLTGDSAIRIGDSLLGVRRAARGHPAPDGDPLVGKIVGGYHIKEVVGRGGMGTVYRATQLSLHRDVALKVLAPELAANTSFRNLFINEARAAGQLVHPNVVQVYDAGTEGEISFFSMEFIGQGSVEEILEREGKIPWEKAILMVLEACHALDYAEKRQIVHRDIKPDNLMIDDDGRVKIADLGLAKRGEGADEQGIIGTPHFIPPEQALGKEVDTRADIYSLGATFFRMITGKTLFTGKTAKEIVLKHIKEPPPAASSVEKSVPPDVDMVLARMLAKDPAGRFQTAQETISALEEICASHGIKGAIIRKGVPKKILVPLIVLLLAAAGTAIYFINKPREKYEDPRTIAEKKAAEARAAAQAKAAESAKRQQMQSQAQNQFLRIKGDLAPQIQQAYGLIDETYLDPARQEERQKAWLGLAKKYDEYANDKDHQKYAPDSVDKAKQQAKNIRDTLANLLATRKSRLEFQDKISSRAKDLRNKLSLAVNSLTHDDYYQLAYEMMQAIAEHKPSPKGLDPTVQKVFDEWTALPTEKWQSPINKSDTKQARDFEKIKKMLDDTCNEFDRNKELISKQAADAWAEIKGKIKAIGSDSTDAEISGAIKTLQHVETAFQAGATSQKAVLDSVATAVAEARGFQETFERQLKAREFQRLKDDRNNVRFELRTTRSLTDGPRDLVMNLRIGDAITEYTTLQSKLKTKKYKDYVQRQIELLRYINWLMSRFRLDVQAQLQKGKAGPLTTLEVDVPTENGKLASGEFGAAPVDAYTFTFAHTSSYGGNKVLSFKDFPVDWVYNDCFLRKGKLRWKADQAKPVLHFALGAFCYETFQFKEAAQQFEQLRSDPRYGPAATALAARSRKEADALAEYKELLHALSTAKTSAELEKYNERLKAFPKTFAGTYVLLDVSPVDEVQDLDFVEEHVPETIPEAPPPPTE